MGTKVEIKGKQLIIAIDIKKATLSKTGRAYVVASTEGWFSSPVKVDGKNIAINVNACYKAK